MVPPGTRVVTRNVVPVGRGVVAKATLIGGCQSMAGMIGEI